MEGIYLNRKRDSVGKCVFSVVFLTLCFVCCQSMENGLNYMAMAFATQLVKILRVGERSVAHGTEADPFHTPEVLMGINAHSSGSALEDCPSRWKQCDLTMKQ